METEKRGCEYSSRQYGKIVLCKYGNACPNKLKITSEEKPLFRCKTDGKIEKLVKKGTPEEVLVTQ